MIEVRVDAPGGEEYVETVIFAAEGALRHERRSGDITFILTDDTAIRTLNRDFRRTDRSTDVLSFPAWEGEELCVEPDAYLGDAAISLPTALRQAEEYGHSPRREISFLAVHATLHLLGYDHMEEEPRRAMFALQEKILEELGICR